MSVEPPFKDLAQRMNRADDSTEPATESEKREPSASARPAPLDPATTAAPAFHSDDVEHVANYQSLSVLALMSLLIGLASFLCLLSNGFLVLSLGGVAISLFALRRIALSEGRLAGRWAAVAGLALCVAFAATAITRNIVVRHMRSAQAEQFARGWLKQIASNELEPAFKLTYDGARPHAAPEPGMPAPEKTPYEAFVSDPLIQKIRAAGKDARIECAKTLDFFPQTRRVVTVRQRFTITPAAASESESAGAVAADLTLQRSHFRGNRDTQWLVMRFEPVGANTPPK